MSQQKDYEVLPGQGAGFPIIEVIDVGDLEWQDYGNCQGVDPELFFPSRGDTVKEAIEVCNNCEVINECLEFALENNERFGIWGGVSERGRRKIKRQQRFLGRIANKNNR